MKKYLFGFAALVLAIAFSAFTKPSTGTVTFKYVGTTLDDDDLEAQENWVEVTENVAQTAVSCENGSFTCTITLDDSFGDVIQPLSSPARLDNDVTVIPTHVSGGKFKVLDVEGYSQETLLDAAPAPAIDITD